MFPAARRTSATASGLLVCCDTAFCAAVFIPMKEVRKWRDLTRLRKKYVHTVGDYRKRVHKLFESANIKIDSVVSDLFGVTGRNLMNLLVSDRKALTLADIHLCVRGKLKGKEEELYRSIQGFFFGSSSIYLEAAFAYNRPV